jgi:hypothetical protein
MQRSCAARGEGYGSLTDHDRLRLDKRPEFSVQVLDGTAKVIRLAMAALGRLSFS